MADGEAVINVSDSRSVSSPLDECSSPLGESPHKLISDCSDLYDLINFHSSATTQIHHDDEDDDERQRDEAGEADDAISHCKTNASTSNSESNEIIPKKRTRSSSSGSSSSAGTDHDSDSGHFSKTNGHPEPEPEVESTTTTEVVSPPDNEELIQITEQTHSETIVVHKEEDESDELNEFSQLEAEIANEEVEQEGEETVEVEMDSVVAPELHDINIPDPTECVLSQHESSPVEEVEEEEPTTNYHQPESAVEESHEDHVQPTACPRTEVEPASSSSDEEEEEAQDEGCVPDVVDGDAISYTERVLPPVIVDVEVNYEQKAVVEDDVPVDYNLDSDKLSDGVESTTTTTTIVELVEDDVKLHVHSSSSSDSDSDYGGKYGYLQKKKSLDQFEKTSTTSTTSSAVITTVVTKKRTAEMKIEQSAPSPITMELDTENSNVKSIRDLELAEMESALTGVNINDLKASFSEHQPRDDEKKSREVIDTGVNIRSLKTCFNSGYKDGDGHRELVVTGVSIAHIKSSFNSTETDARYKEFNENDGVKIDRNKITRNFSQTSVNDEKALICRICGKQVFLMESIKAEKSVFHKSCFRCKECSKPLSVDTYCSHEGILYCRQHFRQLFQPKAKFDEEVIVIPRRRHELIIKENIPQELPPDVVRSADKPDYGLNEIPSLKNVKSRFEDHGSENGHGSTPTVVHVKRSESIASKMAKFQSHESSENGHHVEDSSSSSEDEDIERDSTVVKESKHKRETVVFSGMSQLKNQWESGPSSTKEERAREKQEELAKLRLRMCHHGKGSLKAKYESACEESLKSPGRTETMELDGEVIHTSSIKEKFEKGYVANDLEEEKVERMLREKEDDLSVFKEQGTANDARNLFKQIDATVSKTGGSPTAPSSNVKRSPSMVTRELANDRSATNGDVVKSSDKLDDDYYASVDLTSRFKFFENYKDERDGSGEKKRFTMTPPREIVKEDTPDYEIARDPNIVRCCDKEEEVILTNTARKMLNKFRELESQTEDAPAGPKPLKRITPPREFTKESDSPEPEMARDPNIIRACDKVEDEFLVEAHRAKSLREKFEHWDIESEVERENRRNSEEECQPSLDTAKNLTAKFEALRDESARPSEKPQAKVNRFI